MARKEGMRRGNRDLAHEGRSPVVPTVEQEKPMKHVSIGAAFMLVIALAVPVYAGNNLNGNGLRSEEHTSELQSRGHLVCRLLLEKKNIHKEHIYSLYSY